MQIQLKQAEIIEALKQYISNKGIALSGKTVAIAFTAGRKESGLSADIRIDDADIPGTEVGDTPPIEKPALSVVKVDMSEPKKDAPVEIEVREPPAPKASTTSLFN